MVDGGTGTDLPSAAFAARLPLLPSAAFETSPPTLLCLCSCPFPCLPMESLIICCNLSWLLYYLACHLTEPPMGQMTTDEKLQASTKQFCLSAFCPSPSHLGMHLNNGGNRHDEHKRLPPVPCLNFLGRLEHGNFENKA